MNDRIPSGIKGLDPLLEGGFPRNSVTLVSGNAGTGKTIMGLHFLLEGARKKEKCYYLSFSENKDDLHRAAKGIESLTEVSTYLDKNLQMDRIEIDLEFGLARFNDLIARYPKIDRIVVDNLNKLMLGTSSPAEYRIRLSTLTSLLRDRVSAALILHETPAVYPNNFPEEIFDCDGAMHISYLDLEEKPTRVLQLIKMRYTEIEPLVRHTLTLDKKSMRLTKPHVI